MPCGSRTIVTEEASSSAPRTTINTDTDKCSAVAINDICVHPDLHLDDHNLKQRLNAPSFPHDGAHKFKGRGNVDIPKYKIDTFS